MNKESNKYTRLLSNTVLFGISTFSSKVLSFVLTRLYTGVLSEASYGIVDLVTTCANLLIPLVSLGISNAVIRFGLEPEVSKTGVFTNGIIAILSGFGVLVLFSPLVVRVPMVSQHVVLLYLYVLVSCTRTLCHQFVRAKLHIRLYAIDGILSTLYTVGFNLLFLVVFKLDQVGYLLSIICADALSALGLFFIAKLRQHVSFRTFDKDLFFKMIRYSLPLVPALMFWWVTNASDRLFISFISGPEENGLYAAASKVPALVTILSTIFTEAWQLSAVTDGQGRGRHIFFTNVFQTLAGVAFLMGGGLILLCQPIMRLLVAPAYFVAWQYIPFLVGATVFSCLVSFLNSVYMVEKKTTYSLLTMLAGAAANLILNAILIPDYGANGAALATFFSYVLVFIIRAVHTQTLIYILFSPFKLLINTALLVAIAFLQLGEVPLWPLWGTLLWACMAALNARSLLRGLRLLFQRRKGTAKNA